MNVVELQFLIEFAAKSVGLVVAVFTVFELVSRLIAKGLNVHSSWRERKRLRSLVIVPTAEELAKYSFKIPQYIDPEEKREKTRAQILLELENVKRRERENSRMITLAIMIVSSFLVIAIKFLMLVLE